jgi:hypothetical protein
MSGIKIALSLFPDPRAASRETGYMAVMPFGRTKSPLLIGVVILHLAHAPMPWCDLHQPASLSIGAATDDGSGSARLTDDDARKRGWHLDFVLLGLDPPEDPGQSPVDTDPEIPELALGGVNYIAQPALNLTRFDSRILMDAELIHRATCKLGHPGGRDAACRHGGAFGVSFPEPQLWRTLLSVIIC